MIFTRNGGEVRTLVLTSRDVFGDLPGCGRLQTEVRDRFSGSDRSP